MTQYKAIPKRVINPCTFVRVRRTDALLVVRKYYIPAECKLITVIRPHLFYVQQLLLFYCWSHASRLTCIALVWKIKTNGPIAHSPMATMDGPDAVCGPNSKGNGATTMIPCAIGGVIQSHSKQYPSVVQLSSCIWIKNNAVFTFHAGNGHRHSIHPLSHESFNYWANKYEPHIEIFYYCWH